MSGVMLGIQRPDSGIVTMQVHAHNVWYSLRLVLQPACGSPDPLEVSSSSVGSWDPSTWRLATAPGWLERYNSSTELSADLSPCPLAPRVAAVVVFGADLSVAGSSGPRVLSSRVVCWGGWRLSMSGESSLMDADS